MENNVTALPRKTARPLPGVKQPEETVISQTLAPLQALQEELNEQGFRFLVTSNPNQTGEQHTVTPYNILRVAVHLKAAQQHHAHHVIYGTDVLLEELHPALASVDVVEQRVAKLTEDIRNAVVQYQRYEEIINFLNN